MRLSCPCVALPIVEVLWRASAFAEPPAVEVGETELDRAAKRIASLVRAGLLDVDTAPQFRSRADALHDAPIQAQLGDASLRELLQASEHLAVLQELVTLRSVANMVEVLPIHFATHYVADTVRVESLHSLHSDMMDVTKLFFHKDDPER